MTPTELLTLPAKPTTWLAPGTASDAADAATAWADAGLRVRRLRGNKMLAMPDLMDEISAALQFPYYFGENWDALDECLSDMDWLLPAPALVVLIHDAGRVLADEPATHLEALVTAMKNASQTYALPIQEGEWWDRPAVPFHLVLQEDPSLLTSTADRWANAGAIFERLWP